MPTWTIVYSWAFWPLLAMVCAGCWRWGDPACRMVGAIFGSAMIIDLVSRPWYHWHHLELMMLVVDFGLLMGLSWITIRSPRWWMTGMTAIQLLEMFGHISKVLNPTISQLTYALLIGAGAYPQLFLLAIGLMLDGRTFWSRGGRRV